MSFSISNFSASQLSVTVATPQAGFRCDPSAVVTSDNSTGESAPLLQLNLSGRQGYQQDYSIKDAAASLWEKDNLMFHLNDPDSFNRWVSLCQTRMQNGIYSMDPTKAELTAYIGQLRQTGLDGTVDWSGLEKEFASFQAATPDELADSLDYLASRYTAVQDKLERNGQTAQLSKLEEVYEAGKAGLIDGYTQLLQDNLGLSDRDAQAVRDSFSAILEEKVNGYRSALGRVNEAVTQTGPDSVWLQNHDAYIASELRAAGTAVQSQAAYTVQDLTVAGKAAKDYSAASASHDEARLALNLAMADMKTETMINQGLVSENMAALLRNSRPQAHENALNAADQYLAHRESTRQSGTPAGSFAPIDRKLYQGIYNAVMNAYQSNGGNGAEAIRAGVSYGQTATARARKANPKVSRWGISMETYWKDFYTTREPTTLEKQCNKLMEQAGQTPNFGLSSYQQYVNKWQNFLTSIGSGVDLRG